MNKASFWLVWGVGLVPVMLAAVMYFFEIMTPAVGKHSGVLLQDQHISDWQLVGSDHGNLSRWQLLLTVTDDCSVECDGWWEKLDKVHIALGKDRERVLLQRIGEGGKDLKSETLEQLGDAVWIVDPLGNLVLRYSVSDQPKLLLRDLRKLLKISRIG